MSAQWNSAPLHLCTRLGGSRLAGYMLTVPAGPATKPRICMRVLSSPDVIGSCDSARSLPIAQLMHTDSNADGKTSGSLLIEKVGRKVWTRRTEVKCDRVGGSPELGRPPINVNCLLFRFLLQCFPCLSSISMIDSQIVAEQNGSLKRMDMRYMGRSPPRRALQQPGAGEKRTLQPRPDIAASRRTYASKTYIDRARLH